MPLPFRKTKTYYVDEIDEIKRRMREAESRVAELEADNAHQRERRNAARDCIKKMADPSPWLLRKQAEAVEKAAMQFGGRDFIVVRIGLSEQAQHLRQQAGELER